MSAMVSPALSWASWVLAPRCGVTITDGRENSGDSVVGSAANTSRAAPPTCPLSMAAARSSSTTIPPRATLMMRMPCLALASRSASMSPTVSGVLATWMVTKSLTSMSVSRSTRSMFILRPISGDTNGSWATMRIPKAMARWATSLPMRPRPMTPRVLSASSTPVQRLRSQRPCTSAAWAWGMLRAWANSSAMVCSAADRMFDCGALTTITPRSVAAPTSTLSRPIPARPTTTMSVAAASTSAVTWVAERMMRAWAPGTAASSSSALRPSWTSTVWPAARRRSRPPSAIASVTRMRAIEGRSYGSYRRAPTVSRPMP